jgi:hypothetical protein
LFGPRRAVTVARVKRFLRLLACLLAVCVVPAARAQLSVFVRLERDTYLLYEAIPVVLSVRNYSSRDVELGGSAGRAWLDFVITDDRGALIGATGTAQADEPLVVPAGRTVARKIDLVPLYDLRERGAFQVRARVDSGSTSVLSAVAKFSIVGGRELWREVTGIRQERENASDAYRTYSLQTRRAAQYDKLYVCVRDEQHDLVYGMIPLGAYVALGSPEARVDGAGHLHVLFRAGPRTFGYVHVDPQAKIVNRAVYTDIKSAPQLVSDDAGQVTVRGGEKKGPRRAKSEGEAPSAGISAPPATE